jgi:DNA-binding ferritin-like protein (Dps family)
MEKIIESFRKMIREKAEYKTCRKLVETLPEDYKFVFKEIEKYMFCLAVDESIITVLLNILESFAIAAPNGQSVISITGEDVGLFCDDSIKKFHVKTWIGNQREKMNNNIQKRFRLRMNEE